MPGREKLVILPGWSNHGDEMWDYQIRHLKDRFDIECIVVTERATAEGAAVEVLSKAPPKFVLLGHSMGGLIAQHVALRAPERIKGLILVSTFPGNASARQSEVFEQSMLQPLLTGELSEAWWQNANQSGVAPARINDQALFSRLRRIQGLSRTALINQSKILISSRDISYELRRLSIPALIIYGRQDSTFSFEAQQLMRHALGADLVVLEDCGHLPALEQPVAVLSVLSLWLSMQHSLQAIFA
ncbi:alpha/beta fold hydrolase [Dyella flagellata]|uniref:Hydrolase n=1 Tax=Dyella flagellata TaxID=1867833 RepID=A0ABQ5XG15_9GAMM|nr:alpha/beta hydrolase [Dyella flagellata]GLQ89503.1 hydrolase [Dyella flagellata]